MDGQGNLLFCQQCIIACFGVQSERLHAQRVIKQKQNNQPVLMMTKNNVQEQRVEQYVLHSFEDMQTFSKWWKGLDTPEVIVPSFFSFQNSLE